MLLLVQKGQSIMFVGNVVLSLVQHQPCESIFVHIRVSYLCYSWASQQSSKNGENISTLYVNMIKMHFIFIIGDRPHICQRCGKGFIQKVHLRTHELKHTGERPYLCIDCGNSFLTSSSLKEHVKLHSGIKKVHICSIVKGCNARYSNAADLKVHERKHRGRYFINSKALSNPLVFPI